MYEESEIQNEKNEFTISKQLNDEFLQSLRAGHINDGIKLKMLERLSSVSFRVPRSLLSVY